MDEMELAAEHTEKFTAAAVSQRKPELVRIGMCYFCEEPFPRTDDGSSFGKISKKVFCDIECSTSWEKLGARKG